MTLLRRNLILHLNTAIFIYVLFALLDVYFTLRGVNGNITLEGNPVMRYMMVSFGMLGGLIVEKSLVLLVSLLVAIVAVICIEKEADWIYKLALTRVTRNWMKRKKRYWVAFVPVYFVALAQGLAATSWVCLIP
jgi:type IV secretory pathway VirB3-like protein